MENQRNIFIIISLSSGGYFRGLARFLGNYSVANGATLSLEITDQGQVSGNMIFIETILTDTANNITEEFIYTRSVQGNITHTDSVITNEVDFIAATGNLKDHPYLILTGTLNDSTKTGEGTWVFPTDTAAYGSTQQFIITAKWELTKAE